ncbi:myrosinase 1-like isoform X2 [Ostrinia furnacalis]|uniref:myrosinase 1-like isoform X2 n=1 Tax=Ostrinia furnacalis TaxID=93504 RepID=UPI00103D07D5|nr:myrosinase 1-like isoform X2 [Ostrinia furnacalis]
MAWTAIIAAISILGLVEGWTDTKIRRFPDSFMFGVGSAAYQVEGAWNLDGKGESIWDRFLHENPDLVPDGTNGDVASDSYHHYKRDVEMLREMGVDHYRFSISWPRVMPSGFPNQINEEGFQYYDNLINELLTYKIEPMITLYHFDLPQRLQDLGGWANPLSIGWFEDYARVVFDRYASKVKYWTTMNQPNSICLEGYGDSIMAPGVDMKGIADYICIKNVLLAHAKAYRLYEREYKSKYNGYVGISISVNWANPINNKTENVQATEEYREFSIGMYLNPIWSPYGDFPQVVKDIVAKKSLKQGFFKSRLPSLSAEEKKLLKKSADFLGMNHYTTMLVKRSTQQFPSPSYQDDIGVEFSQDTNWRGAKSIWLKSYAFGIYKALLHINQNYDYPLIIITEHGWSTNAGLWDQSRVQCMKDYMRALLLAMEDGSRVAGYTAWSLMDNLEWASGVSERFGLYEVDFDSEDKKRTARESALVYRHIIEERVVDDWTPPRLDIDISGRRLKRSKKNTEL